MQVLAHGKALLGYTVLGPVALLLVAESVRVSGVLPGGHLIKTVTQSKWHRINLQVCDRGWVQLVVQHGRGAHAADCTMQHVGKPVDRGLQHVN